MTTQGTLDSLCAVALTELQLHGPQRLIQDAEPDVSTDASSSLPESTGLWTDGLPDPAKIKLRMERLAHEFVNKRYQRVTSGHFQFQREIKDRKRAEAEFYGELYYLEDLLYARPAVLPLQPASSTTIVPYTPLAPRRRGRPSTGGRRPRPTTRRGRLSHLDD